MQYSQSEKEILVSSCSQNSPTSFLFTKSILVIFLLFSISHIMAFSCNNSSEIKSCPEQHALKQLGASVKPIPSL